MISEITLLNFLIDIGTDQNKRVAVSENAAHFGSIIIISSV